MSRERMTARMAAEAEDVIKAVEILEKSVKASDEFSLESQAQGQAKEDMKTVNESVPAGTAKLKDQGDQNAKSNKNWPVSEADKLKVAAKLIALAKDLMAEETEEKVEEN
jgi:hypothetical protein